MDIKGFFVDWNGFTRRTENPGPGYTCLVDLELGHVDVLQSDGCYVHEGTYFATLEAVKAAGVEVKLLESTDSHEQNGLIIGVSGSDGIIRENCGFMAAPKSATVPGSGDTSHQHYG
jgi:hypothetical protein